MAQAITCDTTGISSETLERGSYVLMDDGSYAKRVAEVAGGEVMDCDTMQDLETMKRGSYIELSPGQYAQQIVPVT